MKKLTAILLCLLALTACGDKTQNEALKLSEAVLEQKGKTFQDYDVEFELLHAGLYSALLPEENLTVVLLGEGDTEAFQLEEDAALYRLEGRLDVLLEGMENTMALQDFTAALSNEGKEASGAVEISAGTAYYVSDEDQPYAVVRFDSDGDGTCDIRMDVSLNENEMIEPSALAWLYFENETN